MGKRAWNLSLLWTIGGADIFLNGRARHMRISERQCQGRPRAVWHGTRGRERSWRDILERPARDSGHGRRNLGETWKRRRQTTIDTGEAARDQEGARMVCQISQNIRTGSGDNKKWQRIGGVCGVPDLYVHTCRIPDVQVCGCSSLLVCTYMYLDVGPPFVAGAREFSEFQGDGRELRLADRWLLSDAS